MNAEEYERQRSLGWPDIHPEDYCQRCFRPNIVWCVASPLFNVAVERHEIVCPQCFVAAFVEATGVDPAWELRPDPETLPEDSPWRNVPLRVAVRDGV